MENGSFEFPDISEVSDVSFLATIPGWTSDVGFLIWRGFLGFLAYDDDGSQHIEMDASTSGHTLVFQDLDTVPGTTYSLSFALSNRPDLPGGGLGPARSQLEVRWDGGVVLTPMRTKGDWKVFETFVTATKERTRLQFRADGDPDGLGDFLDAVRVVLAPDPEPIVLDSVAPASVAVGGGGFEMTVSGMNFCGNAVVELEPRQGFPGFTETLATTFISETTLMATVPADAVSVSTVYEIFVKHPENSGCLAKGYSNFVLFTVGTPITITSIMPAAVNAGSESFELSVVGANFCESVVFAGATQLATTFIDETHLTAIVPAELVASPRTLQVRVSNDIDNISPCFQGDSAPVPLTVGMPMGSGGPDFAWANRMGGRSGDTALSVAVDGSGNVYTTGYFSGIADFDPGDIAFNLISAGGDDIFVSKVDSAGNFVWARRMGGIGTERGLSLALDSSGNVYTTGVFEGTADFDPWNVTAGDTLTSGGDRIIFVSKLDSDGNFVWAKQMGGPPGLDDSGESDRGFSVAVDGDGNVYTTGYFHGTGDFDPDDAGALILTSAGDRDIFVSKLDSAGDFVWAKQMGGPSADQGFDVAVDGSGNVYTTGFFKGTADFDPGDGALDFTSAGERDIFVSKLDSAGNLVWAKQMGGLGFDQGASLAVDGSGHVVTTGTFEGLVDFDPGPGAAMILAPGASIFLSKLDSAGDFVWAKRPGGNISRNLGIDLSSDVALDGGGNIYMTAPFFGTANFDTGAGTFNLTSAGAEDISVSKLDSGGNFIWATQMGGPSSDVPASLAVDSRGNVYTAGCFLEIADFDPAAGAYHLLTSAGSTDVFVSKLSPTSTGGGACADGDLAACLQDLKTIRNRLDQLAGP